MLRTKGFTLLEMMISLSISTLVLGLGFKAFHNTQSLFQKAQKRINLKEERIAFQYAFRNDFENSQFVRFNNKSISFYTELNEVQYQFGNGFVKRNSSLSDSFRLSIEVISSDYVLEELLSELKVRIISGSETFEEVFVKEYSCSDQLEWEELRQ